MNSCDEFVNSSLQTIINEEEQKVVGGSEAAEPKEEQNVKDHSKTVTQTILHAQTQNK